MPKENTVDCKIQTPVQFADYQGSNRLSSLDSTNRPPSSRSRKASLNFLSKLDSEVISG